MLHMPGYYRGLVAGLAICLGATAVACAADLPIRDVTIYKHGVAYIERSGELKSGETARLDFKSDDMNDILKSLTITDSAGGKVSGIRYDASDPVEKRLADFPFSIAGGSSLSSFLDQAKGARLELKLGAENVAGTILSARGIKDEKMFEREVLVLLLDSGDIRTFAAIGVHELVFDFRGKSIAESIERLQRFAAEVMPLVDG